MIRITQDMIEKKASEVETWEDGYKGFVNGANWVLEQINSANKPVLLNLPFSSAEFQNAWIEWESFRREVRKKLTPSTVKKQVKFLSNFGEQEAIQIINQSIEKGWHGLFPLKKEQNGKPTTNQRTTSLIEGFAKRVNEVAGAK